MLKEFHSAHFVGPYPKLPTMRSTMLETEFLGDLVRVVEGRLRVAAGHYLARSIRHSF